MTRNKSLSASGFPEHIDLHYYASSFSDKQRTAKLLEQRLVRSSLDKSLFKIKNQPFALMNDTHSEQYKELSCRSCFRIVDEPYTNNSYLNLLNIDQLFCLKNSMKLSLKYFRWMFTVNDCSVDVSHEIPKNDELLTFVEEVCQRDENRANGFTYQHLTSCISKACEKFAYGLSFTTLKFIGTLFHLFSSTVMKRLIVSSAEVENVRKAREQDLPILYLLKTPSRIDWFIVLLTLLFTNAKIPVVLRHGNVNSKLLRWIYKKCGVIFIRPPPDNATNYDAKHEVLDEAWLIFLEELIRAKNHFVLDLDTPSIDPDVWPLSVIIHSISRQITKDVLVIPVIVNREQNVEEFLSEKWSEKYSSSKLIDVLRGKLNLGFVKVNFFRPFSLKDLIQASAGRTKDITEIVAQESNSLALKITSHMKYDFSRTHPIMSTDLVSYLLLKKYRNGVRFNDLADEITTFVGEFVKQEKRVGFTGRSHAIIEHAMKILGPQLVYTEMKNDEKFIVPILKLPAVLQLARHAHETMMHSMMDAILFTSISMIFPNEFVSAFKTDTELTFTFNQLLTHAERLRDILQFEYTFDKFCISFYDDLQEALTNACYDDTIKKVEKLLTEEERWSQRYARHLEESEDSDDYSNMYDGDSRSPSPRRNARDNSDTYILNFSGEKSIFKETVLHRNALKPYLQAYALSAEHLNTLNNKQIPIQYYFKSLTDKIKLKLNNGELTFPETLSSNVLQNTLKLFAKWQVIECCRVRNIEFISLSDKFKEANALQQIVEKIDIFD